ncbi:hypothetical protein [Wolbachia endosymbiont (group A) of Sphecodes monilicornis]|nr:hypothetical protein [Wolbachia endosymbiont (group A) of Sphecodes monilicornis]
MTCSDYYEKCYIYPFIVQWELVLAERTLLLYYILYTIVQYGQWQQIY